MRKFASELHFAEALPSAKKFAPAIVIYDKVVARKNLKFKNWLKQFSASYGVDAGEKLKDFDQFAKHLKKINAVVSEHSPKSLKVIAVGGGSVGDFAGFFASIYKRGVTLVQFPTTYLSAIDSAHGGKTALNLAGGKNQIGSFHPAEQVWIISDLLKSQTESQLTDARGELAKIAIIDSKVWKLVEKNDGLLDSREFIELIRPAVEAKMKVVLRDPFEQTGERQILNLGHTLGHVIEARLGIPHGAAVAQGLIFSLRWSAHRKFLSENSLLQIESLLAEKFAIHSSAIPLKRTDFEILLRKDKKRVNKAKVNFVFVRGPGKAFVQPADISEIVSEAKTQGWVR